MANPSDRQELIEYCLRRLGSPVVEVNVDYEQLEDRVDEALQLYREFHDDASVRTYLKHVVTQDDLDNGYVTVSNNILQVIKMFPISRTSASSFTSVKYQFHLNDLYSVHGFMSDIAYYTMVGQHLELLDMKLNAVPRINFQRNGNRLYINGEFEQDTPVKVGDYLVFEVITAIDPETHTEIYNDMWLKEYLTQLIKQQWGQNLSIFEGMQLPGGVTLNGTQIYQDATQEIENLRIRLREEHQEPPMFFIG